MDDDNSFDSVFDGLREILIPYSEKLTVVVDQADHFYLDTQYIMKNKKPMYFASVKLNKNYVSFHLMPVYVFTDLLKDISPELKKRMQGKSCFNFKNLDGDLFQELRKLTKRGYAEYGKAGYL
ncbi:MAG: DUF1801 domain-containing protein [Acidiferrobacterales bacterium]|nr:DUF1801 domain-containing protein [Acidiferrobacterales bacterium]